ncbi:MAG: cation transporter [Chlamydiae bacterium RIFCSPLOWO2_01_FULL_28_7]|nr:MAG: cation transporter [Chlamydiae bacterium RIFCSPLOWO2_01_FULL_28_7]
MQNIHTLEIEEIFKIFNTNVNGLSSIEAEKRLKTYGKNALKSVEESKIKIFFRQFNNLLIYVLFLASLVSLLTKRHIDFFIIIILIIINGLIGFIQEIKSLSSIKALQKLIKSKTKVLRNSEMNEIDSQDLVPGDIVFFREGDVITSDVRLISSESMLVDESVLTGESIPVIKDYKAKIKDEALEFEHKNTLFSAALVVKGRGTGVVTKTGNNTYFATIAGEKGKSPKTPLSKAIESFSRKYLSFLFVFFIIIGAIGFLQGRSWISLLYILLAQLVSAIPEGLPIVVTTVLVVGAIALSKKNTIVRYLPSVETLGSATIIAIDKTGTITQGKLIVKDSFSYNEEKLKEASALCSDLKTIDPLDLAVQNWIKDFSKIQKKYPQLKSFPFDVNERMMGSLNKIENEEKLFVKGAFESLKKIAINKENLIELEEKMIQMSDNGFRVIAVGEGGIINEKWQIKILGLIGFLDPPKKDVKEAVLLAKKAGIKTMMLTGDFPLTAKTIAKEVMIFSDKDSLLTGEEMNLMDDTTLFQDLKKTTVIARILPEHKLRIIKVLQEHKEIVVVSGDGVNDVPALKKADLSIAMGNGTQAAQNVSKMIIQDNNLNVIIEAIKQGRIITSNIRKVIYYLLSTGLQELFLISASIFFNLPLPLTALQILWINIVTDGVQDKTFPFAKEEESVMEKMPKKASKVFFDFYQIINILLFGLFAGLFSFLLFKHVLKIYPYSLTLTITFTSVVLMQWANGIQAQKEKEPFFKNLKRSFSINPYIYLGIVLGLILQLLAVYILSDIFLTSHMKINLWLYPISMFFIAFFIMEIRKWIFYFFRSKK